MATSHAMRRLLTTAPLACCLLTPAPSQADVALADAPLFATVSVPGNLLLALSVEWPTASTPAYLSTVAYDAASTYYGYFDPAKCYRYNAVNSGTAMAPDYSTSYFAPFGAAANHTCASTSANSLWSGNYLNWATTQTLDAFRWAMTGGHRGVDTTAQTIIEKTYHAGYGGHGDIFPDKVLSAGISGATPFNWASTTTRIWNGGLRLWITGTNADISADTTPPTGAVAYTGQNSYNAASLAAEASIYELYVRIKVCDSAVGLEDNCVAYGTSAPKPEGLIQKYAGKLRYSAFGYLTDSNGLRDGGVMRARMKYVGPTRPVPGSAAVANTAAEWASADGRLVANPDTADATNTTNAATAAGHAVTIAKSGVINYLNQFGLETKVLKSYDPVSEMYYAGLRYFGNLGNVPSYSDLGGAGSAATLREWLDGFPVVQTWDDPMVYSCQKNFILGIGDVNTWNDANLPGSTNRTYEPTEPAEVTADAAVNVTTATNMAGQLEGVANLGTYSSGRNNTFGMVGLAYDAHTRDLRTDLSGKQTVATYWVDVLEGQTYQSKNQYWLAAKYGGFTVPDDFQPYDAGNGTTTLPLTSWYTNPDTVGTDRRPDNYFTGGQADKLVDGLNKAFAKIASEAGVANSTALAFASANESGSGSTNYAATYNPTGWIGTVTAATISYASDGTPTLTQQWDARTLLGATAITDRKIITCCNSGAGLAFTQAALSAAAGAGTLSARTYTTSFSHVPGVASGSQSATNFIAYLRGDRTNEQGNGGVYRTRSGVLGDIVNSKLTVVGAPDAAYYDNTNPGYSAFKRAQSSRTPVVYVGANDGMLHAFNGSVGNTGSGSELFAYIPSFVYGNSSTYSTNGLAALGNPGYGHRFFVDATPNAFDVDFSRVGGSTGASQDWRTVLIGGLGKGGKGYYAIDITNPADWTSETAVAGKVLWEFTASTMGYSYGDARVVKTAKYGWTVVLASGYNNSDGKGYLYFLNPKTGALLDTVETSIGSTSSPINLAHITAYIPDQHDYTATALYAADLQGNVWRVDISDDHGSYPDPVRMATLANASGTAQPVSTPVRVMVDPVTAKRYVLVGTGQLLDDSDIASTQLQSFYALIDGTATAFYTSSTLPTGVTFPVTRSNLNTNTDLATGIGSSPAQPMGWYHDLGAASTGGIADRINVMPTVNNGVVGVAVNRPNGDACSPSGTSYVFGVSFGTGQSVLTSNGNVIATTATVSGVVSDIAFKNVGGRVRLYTGRSTGAVTNLPGTFSGAGTLKRLNWREVPTMN